MFKNLILFLFIFQAFSTSALAKEIDHKYHVKQRGNQVEIYDKSWSRIGFIRGNNIYDKQWKRKGFILKGGDIQKSQSRGKTVIK